MTGPAAGLLRGSDSYRSLPVLIQSMISTGSGCASTFKWSFSSEEAAPRMRRRDKAILSHRFRAAYTYAQSQCSKIAGGSDVYSIDSANISCVVRQLDSLLGLLIWLCRLCLYRKYDCVCHPGMVSPGYFLRKDY